MKTQNKLPEAGQHGSKHELSAMAKVEPEAVQYAPSPLEGEGWGEGSRKRAAFTLAEVPEARQHGSKQAAFTLAEVLITLGIIGVVAAMTIPTLTKSIQEKQFTVAARKALSDVNNAYKMMQATDTEFNEIVCNPNFSYCVSGYFKDNFKLLSRQFKTAKTCFTNNTSECWECIDGQSGSPLATPPKYLGCFDTQYAFVDNSGRAWYMYNNYESVFIVDTNGFAGPNEMGKDRWVFSLPYPMNESTNKGMLVPYFSYNFTTKSTWCPSGDCKYKSVFFE